MAGIRRRGINAAFAVAIAGSMILTGSAGLADDADDARPSTSDYMEMSLAELEGELASLSAESTALADAAAEAESDQIRAQADLAETITEAMDSQDAANAAFEEVDEARKELGNIGAAMYRDGASAVPFATYLSAESLNDVNTRQQAYDRLGQSAEGKLQEFEAKLNLAEAMEEQAAASAEAQVDAADEVDEAARDAEQKARAAEEQLLEAESRRDALVIALAEQKGVEAEEEAARVAALEEERLAEAEAARQDRIREAEAQAAAQQQAAAIQSEASQQQREETRPAPTPTPAPAAPSEPAPTPTPTPAPEPRPTPTPTPAPAPEPRPTPTPTPAPAPEPRPTPTPTPTPTPAPAPTPTPTPTPAPAPAPTPTPAPAPTPEPPPAPKPATGTRNSIVSYARQFVGAPYVWGGVTPAGWDCIGFAHYVYAHHGITVARSSYGAQFNGTQVPYSQARPGDMMWWPGHVGIYTGNGSHIAAWNPSMGTQERAVWGSPMYRNVVGD